jgi:hypothetical protein
MMSQMAAIASARRGEGAFRREPRQKRDAESGRDHLTGRLEARRAKILLLRPGKLADLECLVAQAVTLFEQQQFFAGEIGGLHADRGWFGEERDQAHRTVAARAGDGTNLVADRLAG